MKKIFLPLFVVIATALVSCIEYNEKLKLNNDGSGEITFAVGINSELMNMGDRNGGINDFNLDKIKENYTDKDGVKYVNGRNYTKDGNKWIEVTLEFESVEKLANASRDSSSMGLIGDISLKLNENGNWVYKRNLTSGNSVGNKNVDTTSQDMMAVMFSQYKWHYQLTLPSKIISTNAEEADIDFETNTVKWTYSLASLSKKPEMTVTFERQKSTSIIYVIVGGVLLLLLSIAALNLTKKKKSEAV